MTTLSRHYHSLSCLDPFQDIPRRTRNFLAGRDLPYPLAAECSEIVGLTRVLALIGGDK
jgi:hypothetical protein